MSSRPFFSSRWGLPTAEAGAKCAGSVTVHARPSVMEALPPVEPSVDDLVEAAKRAADAGRRDVARAHLERALQALAEDSGPLAAMILRRIGRTYLDDGD